MQPRLVQNLRDASDHVPILVSLPLSPDRGPEGRHSIKPDSDAEKAFVGDLAAGISAIDTRNLDSVERIDLEVDALSSVINNAWLQHSKEVRISKHSNPWWNDKCEQFLYQYHVLRTCEDYQAFCTVTKQAKRVFFDKRVGEITVSNSRP